MMLMNFATTAARKEPEMRQHRKPEPERNRNAQASVAQW